VLALEAAGKLLHPKPQAAVSSGFLGAAVVARTALIGGVIHSPGTTIETF
jgi:hypothetical protein